MDSVLNDTARLAVLALLASPRTRTHLEGVLHVSGTKFRDVANELTKAGFLLPRAYRDEPYTLSDKGHELAALYIEMNMLVNRS